MSDPKNRPASPASSSRSSSPPLQLDPSTLAALSSFYDERAEAERQFAELEKKAHERLVHAQDGQVDGGAFVLVLETDEAVWWASAWLRQRERSLNAFLIASVVLGQLHVARS
jgi:hypothetical protein